MAVAQVADLERPRGSVSGTVFAADGRPTEGIKVRLQRHAGGPSFEVLTRSGGEFVVNQLPLGTYLVAVEERGYKPIQQTVELEDGSQPKVLLYLEKVGPPRLSTSRPVVSVRELSIPPKAYGAFQSGLERLAKKDPAGSLPQFERAARAFPGYYEAYYEMGMALRNLGRDGDAERAFRKSIELSADRYAPPQFGLGLLLCGQKKFAEAEPAVRKGLELDPDSGLGDFALAWAMFGLTRLDDAEKNAREAVTREPTLAQAHLLLANIYILRHDDARMLGELEAFLKLEPNGAMSARARQTLEAAKRGVATPGVPLASTMPKP